MHTRHLDCWGSEPESCFLHRIIQWFPSNDMNYNHFTWLLDVLNLVQITLTLHKTKNIIIFLKKWINNIKKTGIQNMDLNTTLTSFEIFFRVFYL
jgi:hypothetical protein